MTRYERVRSRELQARLSLWANLRPQAIGRRMGRGRASESACCRLQLFVVFVSLALQADSVSNSVANGSLLAKILVSIGGRSREAKPLFARRGLPLRGRGRRQNKRVGALICRRRVGWARECKVQMFDNNTLRPLVFGPVAGRAPSAAAR